MRRLRGTLLVSVGALLVACGSESAATPVECGDDLATDQELVLTPRDDLNLEKLAIVATGRVVAGQEEYERVVQDVGSIREVRPDLRDIEFFSMFGQGLRVWASEETLTDMKAGRYQAWDCLNNRFGVTEMTFQSFLGTSHSITFEFDGVYNIP